MTLTGGGSIISKLISVTLGELVSIGTKRAESHDRARIAIDIDVSWLGYRFSKRKSGSVGQIVSLTSALCREGVAVRWVADGIVRSYVKRASTLREAERRYTREASTQAMADLLHARTRLRDVDYATVAEKQAIEKEVEALEKHVKTCENKSATSLPSDFYDQLAAAVPVVNCGHRGGSVRLVRAQYQADFVMAYGVITGATDLVIANDGDFHVLIGDASLSIKDFKLGGEDGIYDIELTSGSFSRISEASSWIEVDANADRCKKSNNPLLDGQSSKMRALMGVALGCDVYPKKIFTPAKLRDTMAGLPTDADPFDSLVKDVAMASTLSIEAVRVYVDAMLYEPANLEGEEKVYLHGAPAHQLAHYLKEFNPDGEAMIDGPAMLICPGPGSECGHVYLEAEGPVECHSCERSICPTCLVDSNKVCNVARNAKGEEALDPCLVCMECYSGNTILPDYGDKSFNVMKAELAALNIGREQGLSAATFGEVATLYDEYVVQGMADPLGELVGEIAMPLMSCKCLDPTDDSALHVLFDHDMREGGSFMQHDLLDAGDLVKLTQLFATFLVLDTAPTDKRRLKYSKVVPKYVMDMAEALRVDDGLRLVARSARHWKCSRFGSLWYSKARFFKLEDGTIGVWLSHTVPASFKSDQYTTEVAFANNAVVACKCSCDAGSECKSGHDRHADVHVLPLAMAMMDLLSDPENSLAESILTSLAARWNASDDNAITSEERGTMVDALAVLLDATTGCVASFADKGEAISAMLDTWNVGTEREKAPPPPADPTKLGELRRFRLVSNAKKGSCEIEVGDAEGGNTAEAEGRNSADNGVSTADSNNSDTAEAEGGDTAAANRGDAADAEGGNMPIAVKYDDICFGVDGWCKEVPTSNSSLHKEFPGHRLCNLRRPKVSATVSKFATSGFRAEARSAIGLCDRRSRSQKVDVNPSVPSSRPEESRSSKRQRIGDESAQEEQLRYCDFGKGSTCRCPFKSTSRVDFRSLPRIQKKTLPKKVAVSNSRRRKAEDEKRKTHYRKVFLRNKEWMSRCAISSDNAQVVHLQICRNHPMEEASLQYDWYDVDGKKKRATVKKLVPMAIGDKSVRLTRPSESASLGLGPDRLARKVLEKAKDDPLALQQYDAMNERDEEGNVLESILGVINDSVAMKAGLDVHVDMSIPVVREISGKRSRDAQDDSDSSDSSSKIKGPVVHPLRTDDEEVKRCTGFASAVALLSFVTVVCNGDFELLQKTSSEMTWYEEWFMYFEIVWGRSSARWIDVKAKYGLSRGVITRVFVEKLRLVLEARDLWPTYASMEEDEELRDDKWNLRYTGRRIVFWDGTDIRMPKPSNPDLQRLTYSRYYGGNVGKGGVFLQLCGWGGVGELWTGAVSDTDYMNRSGILEEQEEFVAASSHPGVPFTNVLDKGYRLVLAALRAGGQYVLQPYWKKSDRKFTSKELLVSAAVAADRAANERQVNVAKRAGFLQRGAQNHQSLVVLADV